MKSLGFGYRKSYIIPAEATEDASEQLKKHQRHKLGKKNILVFANQTPIQNKDNTIRLYIHWEQKIDRQK